MITRETKFSELVNLGMNIVEDPASCKEMAVAQKQVAVNPDLTVGDFIDGKVSGVKDEGHFYGVLIEKGDECSPEVREGFIKKIKDPMIALQLYMRLKSVTNEEKKILKEKFKGLLPTAEKELKEGKIKK